VGRWLAFWRACGGGKDPVVSQQKLAWQSAMQSGSMQQQR